jgi:sugar-phosphatase
MGVETAAALLFDMDGTLLDSHRSFDRIWGRWSQRNGVDYAAAVGLMRGGRAVDIVRRFAPLCPDPVGEARRVEQEELTDLEDTTAIPGAKDFLAKLPDARWAIVTSAIGRLAHARLGAAGLPIPATLVAAEDVAEGKPSPAGYCLAAHRLGCEPRDCIVFEDAMAGVEAAEAAGARVIVVAADLSRKREAPRLSGRPTIASYDELTLSVGAAGLILRW